MSAKVATITQVDRRSNLTRREFTREYCNPNLPVVLTDLTKDWAATKYFSLEFFQENLGDRNVDIAQQVYKLGEFIQQLKQSNRQHPAPYPCILNVSREFPELARYLGERPAIAKPDRTANPLLPTKFIGAIKDLANLEVFLGGPGGEFPTLHYDLMGVHTFSNLLYGRKEFTLFSPDQQQYLYPHPDRPFLSEIESHHHPDLNKYPLFAKTTPITVVLSPGDTIFIPSGWYHTARSLTLTISTQFDLLCQSNWLFFMNECDLLLHKSPLKSKVVRAYLAGLGAVLTALERVQRLP